MKKIICISFIFLVLSCEKKTTETRYYPTDREFSNESPTFIGLDTTQLNFQQITNKAGTDYNNVGKLVGLNLKMVLLKKE